jgi:hypothetical protein
LSSIAVENSCARLVNEHTGTSVVMMNQWYTELRSFFIALDQEREMV